MGRPPHAPPYFARRHPAQEIVTLMGPSGSGKSTLFAWMVGALSADFKAHGELWLNDRRCD
ncbi:ATP-binding cassette domain-containing protein, partial [Enterobacter hormaechei]|nr:ATP-binding cassette domain-containing protein [Enterobacter hormaechei]